MSGERRFPVRRWVRVTIGAWFLGLVLLIVLAMLVGGLGVDAQFMVGAGIGISLGFFHRRVLRDAVGEVRGWFWATFLGLTAPFLAADVLGVLGVSGAYSLPLAILAAAVLSGAWQERILRRHLAGTGIWIPAWVLGWIVQAVAMQVNDTYFRNLPGWLVLPEFLGMILVGGLAVALFTGWALDRMTPRANAVA